MPASMRLTAVLLCTAMYLYLGNTSFVFVRILRTKHDKKLNFSRVSCTAPLSINTTLSSLVLHLHHVCVCLLQRFVSVEGARLKTIMTNMEPVLATTRVRATALISAEGTYLLRCTQSVSVP